MTELIAVETIIFREDLYPRIETSAITVQKYAVAHHKKNPADPRWLDIERFRVKRVWPDPEALWRTLTPEEWAAELVQLRDLGGTHVDRLIDSRENAMNLFAK